MSSTAPPIPPPPPAPRASKSPTESAVSGWAGRAWAAFRRWPIWAQVAAWVLGFWLLVPLLAWRSSLPIAAKWVVTAAAILLFIGAVTSSDASSPQAAAPTVVPSSVSPTTSPPSPTPTADPVTIRAPKVLGLPIADAEAALRKAVKSAGPPASLKLTVTREYSSKPPGTVFKAAPADYGQPGTTISADTFGAFTVFLAVAKQIPPMPNVVGMKQKDATKRLDAIGYSVKTKSQVSSSPEGTVLGQSIPAGKRVVPDKTTVTLTVAKPPQGYYVRVIGSGSAQVTWGNIGSTHQVTVSLPFTAKVTGLGSYDVITVLAQRQSGDSGSITCQIIYSGHVDKSSTSSGPYSICQASESA